MNHKFCVQCGAKNYYDSVSPVFCSKCGKNMEGGAVEEVQANIKVKKMEYEIERPESSKETVGDAIFRHSAPRVLERGGRGSPLSGKDVVEETKKACAPVKESKSID